RRRDIRDLLSGTGRGPRSYSIIEQGTISRLVESKPQDLRVFLEEAAGITKYKERKRDTENRIRHCRENLARLADLRHELASQISSLEGQAKLAEQYSELKKNERELNQNIIVLRWQRFFDELTQTQINLQQSQDQCALLQVKIDEQQLNHQARDNELTEKREQLSATDALVYQSDSHITRLQLGIEHLLQAVVQGENNLAQLKLKVDGLTKQHNVQLASQHSAQQELQGSTTRLPLLAFELQQLQTQLSQQDTELEQIDRLLAQLHGDKQRIDNQYQIEKQGIERIEHDQLKFSSQSQLLKKKQTDYMVVQQKLQPMNVQAQFKELQQAQQNFQLQWEQGALALQDKQSSISSQTKAVAVQQSELDTLRNEQQTFLMLIDAQMSKDEHALIEHFSEQPQLWQIIDAQSDWQLACETVLGPFLKGFVLDKFSPLTQLSQHCQLWLEAPQTDSLSSTEHKFSLLSDVVSAKSAKHQPLLQRLLHQVYCSDDLNQAQKMLPHLCAGESVVTKTGQWLSHGHAVVGQQVNATSSQGLLVLNQRLDDLTPVINSAQHQLSDSQSLLTQSQAALEQMSAQHGELEQQLNQQNELAVSAKQKWLLEQQQWQHITAQIEEVVLQLTQLSRLAALDNDQLSIYQAQCKEHVHARKELEQQIKSNQQLRHIGKSQQKTLQSKSQNTQQQHHQQQLLVQKHQLLSSSASQQCSALAVQINALNDELAILRHQVSGHQQPLAQKKAQIATLHSESTTYQTRQQVLKQRVSTLISQAQENSQLFQQLSISKDKQQKTMAQLELKTATLKIKISAQEQALQQSQRELLLLAQTLKVTSDAKQWPVQLAVIRDQLSQMGAINLTAIEQYNKQKERLDYLNAQNDDLEQGLNTLESAIKKIDRQSRDKFKRTFDAVNADFKLLFPKVFGGGTAQLTLTDSDLLLSGVSIMAQPPGKKNSTIHLLSGGEKALTALSLVFAIFQLNPAPFCMLDEVDAPLDDANVVRYCNLVKEMSEKVQFIFITHNKVSMEMATQLLGITMQEAGVSRVVAVDVDAAVSLAQQ
ncbi:MAG: chromosome segregation protein SMC, partial [Psychrobium sp.]|nr:chromosome segregation protein SMC [Psychrobium sp.]